MEFLSSLYERWKGLARWTRWIIIILLGVAAFGLLYLLKVKPLQEELAAKEKQAEQLALTVSRLKAVEKRKKELEKEIEELNLQIAQIEEKLPTGKEEVSQILRSITGPDSGVVIKKIAKEKKRDQQYYVVYPYAVEIWGTYPAFVKWCEALSRADRIINFGDMDLYALKAKKKKGKEEKLPYTMGARIEIKAFTLKR